MPNFADLTLYKNTDVTLTVSVSGSVSGMGIQFQMLKRFDGVSGLVVKTMVSGTALGVSGITPISSGFRIAVNAAETSGMDEGSYPYRAEKTNSGSRTVIQEGWCLLYD